MNRTIDGAEYRACEHRGCPALFRLPSGSGSYDLPAAGWVPVPGFMSWVCPAHAPQWRAYKAELAQREDAGGDYLRRVEEKYDAWERATPRPRRPDEP